MDINEITDRPVVNRHPWELSRAGSLLWELEPCLAQYGEHCRYLDFGAGDQFFDDALLDRHPGYTAAAVDLGYTPEVRRTLTQRVRNTAKIQMATTLDEPIGAPFDFALLLDSMEYMEDEAEWLKRIVPLVKNGGCLLISVPAFRILDCEHDRIVHSLRRYEKKRLRAILRQTPELEILRMHYFFTPLFVIRFIQKFSGMKIDPQRRIIRGWTHERKSLPTRLIKGVLDADYRIHAGMSRLHADLPGLSLMVICRKTGEKK